MRWLAAIASAVTIGSGACLAQTPTDRWKATEVTKLSAGVRAEISIEVIGTGANKSGRIALTCAESETLLSVDVHDPSLSVMNPNGEIGLKFDRAPIYQNRAFYEGAKATIRRPTDVAEFIKYGRPAASLYVKFEDADGRRVNLPNFSMYGFTETLRSLPSDCVRR